MNTARLAICLLFSPFAMNTNANAAQGSEIVLAIPVTGDGQLPTRICRPADAAPARLVIINHGSPASAKDRPRMTPGRCDQEAAQWFLSRGFVVAFPLRRGYGASGGRWAEDYGPCNQADYFHAGLETARDIDAAVESLTRLPFIRPDGVVVVGQSAGGWGAIAYDSVAHPKVDAFIVMAGGRGGHMHEMPSRNCHTDRLAEAAGRFGKTATTPMLWVYAANDTYFGPHVAQALYAAFTVNGGRAELKQPDAFGADGHTLFYARRGSAIWGPLAESYLSRQLASGAR
jgi:dienelactone hydrolase